MGCDAKIIRELNENIFVCCCRKTTAIEEYIEPHVLKFKRPFVIECECGFRHELIPGKAKEYHIGHLYD
jgi:hypothetical protein